MPDQEKVIKTLTDALSARENYPWAKAEMSFEFIEMLLELLKEQETVVRCKDCKHGKRHGIDVECTAHEEIGYDPEPWHPLDWFCADGERKEVK